MDDLTRFRERLFAALRDGPPLTVAIAADTAVRIFGPEVKRLRRELGRERDRRRQARTDATNNHQHAEKAKTKAERLRKERDDQRKRAEEAERERDAVLRHDEEAVRQLNAAEADIGAWRDSWRRERDRLGLAEAERGALQVAIEQARMLLDRAIAASWGGTPAGDAIREARAALDHPTEGALDA